MPSNNPHGNNQHTTENTRQGSNQGGQGSSSRGFASMDPQRQREIAAEGGRAAHASGNAHEFTSQEAREAGSKSHSGSGQGTSAQGANNMRGSSGSSNTRGASSQQQPRAGNQSHKNDR